MWGGCDPPFAGPASMEWRVTLALHLPYSFPENAIEIVEKLFDV